MATRAGDALVSDEGVLALSLGAVTFHPQPGNYPEEGVAAIIAVPPPTPSPSAWANDARDVANDARCALLNNGYLRLYSAGFAALLVELVFSSPAFAPSSGSLASLSAPLLGPVILAGTIAAYRAYRSDGTTLVCSGTVSGLGGGGNIEIVNVTVTLADTVRVSTLVAMQG